MGVPKHGTEGEDDITDLVFSDPDGTPLSVEELARSLDEAWADLRRNGPVPAAEVARMLEEMEAEWAAEHVAE